LNRPLKVKYKTMFKSLLDRDDVLSAGDDVAVPALGQSNFSGVVFWLVVSSFIFNP
jgi:hypothetical protein